MKLSKRFVYLLRKMGVLLASVLLMALGAALYFKAGMGADPISTLCDGLYRSFGVDRGSASFLMNGGIFLVFLLVDRRYANLGSVFAAFGVGPFITLFSGLLEQLAPGVAGLPTRIFLPLLGSVSIALGRALYLPCNCGAAPFDMMVLSLCSAAKWPYRRGFIFVSSVIFSIGLALRGAWGYGTLVAIFLTGWIVDFLLKHWGDKLKRFTGSSRTDSA